MKRIWLSVCVLSVLCFGSSASADDCSGLTLEIENAKGARPNFALALEMRPDAYGRSLVFREKEGAPKVLLSVFPQHSHIKAFVPKHGHYFVLIDVSAGRRLDHRIVFVDARGALISTISLRDLVPEKERAHFSESISHLRWLQSAKFSKAQDALVIETKSGRTITLSMGKYIGKVLSNVPPS